MSNRLTAFSEEPASTEELVAAGYTVDWRGMIVAGPHGHPWGGPQFARSYRHRTVAEVWADELRASVAKGKR